MLYLRLILLLALSLAHATTVVDHGVLFKMPGLSSNPENERKVLSSLNTLRSFPGVITFFTGRLLKEVDGFTHGLFARFLDQATLLRYYNSLAFLRAILPQLRYLRGENSVDYYTTVNDNPSKNFPGEVFHVSFFRFKPGMANSSVFESIRGLPAAAPSIVLQTTVGSNLYDRDFVYSHAFIARLASEAVVDDFYAHPAYRKVEEELRATCLLLVSADFLGFSG